MVVRQTPAGHPRESNAVFDDVEQLAVREFLDVVRAQVGHFRRHSGRSFGLTAPVLSMANGAVLLMFFCFGQNFRRAAQRITELFCVRRDRESKSGIGNRILEIARLLARAEPLEMKIRMAIMVPTSVHNTVFNVLIGGMRGACRPASLELSPAAPFKPDPRQLLHDPESSVPLNESSHRHGLLAACSR